jgi:two-component system chemotaxis response regulator CheB
MAEPVKVLIVEDSPTVSRILTGLIEADPQLEVVGVATDGAEAIRMTSRLRPNIITMDVNMPRMGGLEATEYIMAHQPTPILVLTAFGKHDLDLSFKMLSAGALEFIEKPDAIELARQGDHLLSRIKLLARIKVITHPRAKNRVFNDATSKVAPPASPEPPAPVRMPVPIPPNLRPTIKISQNPALPPLTPPLALSKPPAPSRELLLRRFQVVGIAASTGGPPALARLLRELRPDFPVPILVVQHIPAGFSRGLADWLDSEIRLKVRQVEEGEKPVPGMVYLPADDRHLTFNQHGRFHLGTQADRFGLRPNADNTFLSMAEVWPGETLAVILTGMGRDGTEGMKKLYELNGYNIAQDEASSVIFGMPKAAIDAGVVHQVLPLNHIAPFLNQIFHPVEPAWIARNG